MNTIWKFTLRLDDGPQQIEIPKNGQLLHFDMQDSYPTVWVLVDTEAPRVTRQFVIHGTGHPIEDTDATAWYIGTCKDGAWIWHLFELLPL